MRWQNSRRSKNVEDRRGKGRAVAAGGGLGIIGLLAVFLLSNFLGADPQAIAPIVEALGGSGPAQNTGSYRASPEEEQLADMSAAVLGWTEDVWTDVYPAFARKYGTQIQRYRPTQLVLFSGATSTACGQGKAATGPFYCPADQKVYIDLSFYRTMRDRMGAPGDFAQAYVIAHEVGHHIQNLMGLSMKVQRQQRQVPKVQANQLSVRIELMADYLAGIWAYHVHQANLLEPGDIEEAIRAANQIGDDVLQRSAGARVRPHTFTHGTAAQRKRWFALGMQAAQERDYTKYDTFAVAYNQL